MEREDEDSQFLSPFASSLRLCVKSPVPVRTVRISLTMIVKNEEENIPKLSWVGGGAV